MNSMAEEGRNIEQLRDAKERATNRDVNNFFNAFNGMNQDSRNIILQKLGISWSQIKSLEAQNKNTQSGYNAEKMLNFTAFQSSPKSRSTRPEHVSRLLRIFVRVEKAS